MFILKKVRKGRYMLSLSTPVLLFKNVLRAQNISSQRYKELLQSGLTYPFVWEYLSLFWTGCVLLCSA